MALIENVVDMSEPVTSENKCDLCTGSLCCTYVTQQIDKPSGMKDFDLLLWQVSHDHVNIFKDEGEWFLAFNNRCQHLQDNGGCGIYDKRPLICREHSNDYCEYDQPAEEGFDLFFPDYESFDNYCRKRFKKWDKRFEKWGVS